MAVLLRSSAVLAAFFHLVAAGPRVCPAGSPLSCHNTTAIKDTCCFVSSGQLLQTQSWDYGSALSPKESWTIHGLWPDNCDGSYPTQCDPSRAYTDLEIETVMDLHSARASETLGYMRQFWQDDQGNEETFWEHEWAKHGTCISTLNPTCYNNYKDKEEAVDYFQRTVDLFQTLPTYQWLADAGIIPSPRNSYSLTKIQDVLSERHGAPVTLRCKGKALNEVWYHFNVEGSLQTGVFVPSKPDGAKGNCPSQIMYQPKPAGSV